MKLFLAIVLIGISLTACTRSADSSAAPAGSPGLTDDARHRLYAAALAAIESPLESDTFKDVCQKIGVFDVHGKQNDSYMEFVKAHVEWAMKAETAPFKEEIKTREKAREYLTKYLPLSRRD